MRLSAFRVTVSLVCGLWTVDCGRSLVLAAGEVRAGVAQEVFTLPERVPLAGYSRRKGAPAAGRRDPVGVRALVLEDGDTTTALVSCDLLTIPEQVSDAVTRRLASRGLPQIAPLLIAATHTHSGPGAYGRHFLEELSLGRYDPAVFEAIVEAVTQAIVRAHAALVPVRMAYLTAPTDGLVVNRANPNGLVDAELTVCVWVKQDRAPLAVLVNFSAHPTTLGSWNLRLSADYPGVVVREVERSLPGTTCLFFAGAVGDQAPVKEGRGDEPVEQLGQALTRQVLPLVERARTTPPDAVSAVQERVTLPPARVRMGRATLPHWLSRVLADDDATLSLVAVGDAVFLGMPCDLFASLGAALKHEAVARGFQPVIIGFANDYIGYCIPEAVYATDTYAARMAFNGPTTGPLLVNRLTELLDQLAEP